MIYKQKFYNFLAVVCDYEGCHYIANLYRKGNVNMLLALFDLLAIWTFLFMVLLIFIWTKRFHSPNCDCDDMKHIKFSKKLDVSVDKYGL